MAWSQRPASAGASDVGLHVHSLHLADVRCEALEATNSDKASGVLNKVEAARRRVEL